MAYYSYKMEHDYGLAPNPFWGYCTLAVCKPQIRNSKRLKIGDWVICTGSKSLNKLHHLILLMQVEEKIRMKDYWDDPRFQLKKPIINGSLTQMYGDNIYRFDNENNTWHQENSAHSLNEGLIHAKHTDSDTGGNFVLLSKTFYYFGEACPKIPDEFLPVCCEARNYISEKIPINIADRFVEWVKENYNIGIHGDPINWKDYELSKINYQGFD